VSRGFRVDMFIFELTRGNVEPRPIFYQS
jgi:hypothetical protein